MKSFESFRKGERGNNAKNNAKIEVESDKKRERGSRKLRDFR